jgi:fructosamine-3-kinase
MHQDNDISWHVLRRIVQEWAGTSAELAEVTPLEGGCINHTLCLTTKQGEKAVLKIASHRINLELKREAHQLDFLRSLGMPTPRVYLSNIASLDNPDSYLLMEFMEGIDLGTAKQHCSAEQFDDLQQHLAELVLALHGQTNERYCRVRGDESPQFEQWAAFYRHIYDPIWHDVEKSDVLPIKSRKQIGRVHERLERLLAHDDRPRLVHWDIWATNLLCRPDELGRWRVTAVLDPNCKFAHAEAEIAYMELFHTVTPAFMKAYQQARKLPEGYHRVRKPVYQLYPLINHVHLFGNDYLKPLMGAVEKTASLV